MRALVAMRALAIAAAIGAAPALAQPLSTVEGGTLVAAAIAQVRESLGARYELELRADGPVADVAVPRGKIGIEPRALLAGGRVPPRVAVRVDVSIDGSFHRQVSVPIAVRAIGDVLVARGDLAPLTAPRPEEFETRRMDVTKLAGEAVEASELKESRLTRQVRAGEALTRRSIQRRPAVARGEAVVLQMQGPSVRLEARAVVLADAHVGDSVWIRREASDQPLKARVVAPGLVEVATP
jgi:flagella basal body P-ring formation protein FlgA